MVIRWPAVRPGGRTALHVARSAAEVSLQPFERRAAMGAPLFHLLGAGELRAVHRDARALWLARDADLDLTAVPGEAEPGVVAALGLHLPRLGAGEGVIQGLDEPRIGTVQPNGPALAALERLDDLRDGDGNRLRDRHLEVTGARLVHVPQAAGALVGHGDALGVPARDAVIVVQVGGRRGVALVGRAEGVQHDEPVVEAVAGLLARRLVAYRAPGGAGRRRRSWGRSGGDRDRFRQNGRRDGRGLRGFLRAS